MGRYVIKGAAPRGPTCGDQEQWEFPDVELEDWERKLIIAEVVSLATKAMFSHHFYKYGGATYHQGGGGPIGLRGTCAIARMAMQLFDNKWKMTLEELGVKVWLLIRYVDDMRVALPPIREGWRWLIRSKHLFQHSSLQRLPPSRSTCCSS